jgi:Molybdopterin oxidoreductase
MHPFIHPLSAAVDPVWETRSDWETYKAIARRFSDLAVGHLGLERDVVLSPIPHEPTPTTLRLVPSRYRIAAPADKVAISDRSAGETWSRSSNGRYSGWSRRACGASSSRHVTDFTSWPSTGEFRARRRRSRSCATASQSKESVEEQALRQDVSILAGQAQVTGVDLQGATSPLVQ